MATLSAGGRHETLTLRAVRAVARGVRPGPGISAMLHHPIAYAVMVIYGVGSTVLMVTHTVGVTSDHGLLLGILVLALVMRSPAVVWDWLPFVFVGVMFEDLSAFGGAVIGPPHTSWPIGFEQTLLGGNVGAVWLQSHLPAASTLNPINVIQAILYLAHFGAPFLAGLWLYRRHRARFGSFVNAYILVMTAGFAIYLIYPETPPWLAAQHGALPPIHRVVVDVVNRVVGAGSLYSGADPYPYGAMPALHVTIPTLIALAISSVRGWRRPTSFLWWAYPLALGFGVVYLGEHYVLDVVCGIALGVGAWIFVEIGWRQLLARAVAAVWAHPPIPAMAVVEVSEQLPEADQRDRSSDRQRLCS